MSGDRADDAVWRLTWAAPAAAAAKRLKKLNMSSGVVAKLGQRSAGASVGEGAAAHRKSSVKPTESGGFCWSGMVRTASPSFSLSLEVAFSSASDGCRRVNQLVRCALVPWADSAVVLCSSMVVGQDCRWTSLKVSG